MAFNNNITPGAAPLLWSNVYEAFTKINENFDILVATVGDGSGLTPVNFESLDTGLKPTTDNLHDIGDITHKWRGIYAGEYSVVDSLNGLWAGSAQIKGVGLTVNLPENSTIGGDPITGIGTSLIIDPEKTFFKTVDVDNGNSVVATEFGSTLNLLSGSGISMTVNSSADSIEIDNTGILSVAAGSGVSVATVSGAATVTNTGVRSLTSTTVLPSGRTAGAGINIDNSTGDGIKITNAGVISISNGVGITVSTDAATGDVTITNSAPAVNAYTQFEINGDSANRISADAVSDVLFINSGEGITLTKNTSTDTLTFTIDPVFDLKGSVFGDDSSILVDAVSNYIYGNVSATTLRTSETSIALGDRAGSSNQDDLSVAVGKQAGETDQGTQATAVGSGAGNNNQDSGAVAVGANAGAFNQGLRATAIGSLAGSSGQGDYAVAIGNFAGGTNQPANSIILNASGLALNGAAAAFYVDPVRNQTGASGVVQYDSTTKEISYSTTIGAVSGTFTGNIFTNLIDSADSSAITVTPATIFSSDVTVENDLNVTQRLQVQGSRVINLAELQSVVAASADFTDFQARIAALV